ncbi:PREDICTED: uncharacterized protein LOC105555800 [Vollenhovia emeryi]|uniref:uncharacterized protein LOC105555800 n=1 Tax=Vollenhovia emeryi TaxID=411798 RepID=UPI0005F46ECA|nr:PREDICTED: uncharacterized protein LOC105555800 [Vollenhovia emeryi]
MAGAWARGAEPQEVRTGAAFAQLRAFPPRRRAARDVQFRASSQRWRIFQGPAGRFSSVRREGIRKNAGTTRAVTKEKRNEGTIARGKPERAPQARVFVERRVNGFIGRPMIEQTKDFAKGLSGGMSTYERPGDAPHLSTITRIVGVCTAVGESR